MKLLKPINAPNRVAKLFDLAYKNTFLFAVISTSWFVVSEFTVNYMCCYNGMIAKLSIPKELSERIQSENETVQYYSIAPIKPFDSANDKMAYFKDGIRIIKHSRAGWLDACKDLSIDNIKALTELESLVVDGESMPEKIAWCRKYAPDCYKDLPAHELWEKMEEDYWECHAQFAGNPKSGTSLSSLTALRPDPVPKFVQVAFERPFLFAIYKDTGKSYNDIFDVYECYYDGEISKLLFSKQRSKRLQDCSDNVQFYFAHNPKGKYGGVALIEYWRNVATVDKMDKATWLAKCAEYGIHPEEKLAAYQS